MTKSFTFASHTATCTYVIPKMPNVAPTKFLMRWRMRPMGMDVLDDREWITRELTNPDCTEFKCMLNPDSPDCKKQ